MATGYTSREIRDIAVFRILFPGGPANRSERNDRTNCNRKHRLIFPGQPSSIKGPPKLERY